MESLARSLGRNLLDKVHVVGIIGSQQGGKSTLLNNLFGTEFKTNIGPMSGIERCTDGILIAGSSPSLISGHLLVIDVEGVDGIERPNNEEYEGRATLFTLAVAEVLIVNMNFSDIGRIRGGNYPMLEAVFQAALKMDITHGEKTTLLFAFRDYNFVVQISDALRKVKETLENIWRNMKKPEAKKDALLESYFNVDAVGLPHLMPGNQPTTDRVAVDALRRRFFSVGDDLFGANKNYTNTRVFLQLLGRTWDVIKSNQIVGIFSIRQCIAKIDCDKASQDTQEKLVKKAEDLIVKIESEKGTVYRRMECRNEKSRLEGLFTAQAPTEFREMYTTELTALQGRMQREVEKYERDYDRIVAAEQTKRECAQAKNDSSEAKKSAEKMTELYNTLSESTTKTLGEMSNSLVVLQSKLATETSKCDALKSEIAQKKEPYTALNCSLGIGVKGDILSSIVARGARLPATETGYYSTSADYQESVTINVFAGEDPVASGSNRKLGSVTLSGLDRALAGVVSLRVKFEVSVGGQLKVVLWEEKYPNAGKTEYFNNLPTCIRRDWG